MKRHIKYVLLYLRDIKLLHRIAMKVSKCLLSAAMLILQ